MQPYIWVSSRCLMYGDIHSIKFNQFLPSCSDGPLIFKWPLCTLLSVRSRYPIPTKVVIPLVAQNYKADLKTLKPENRLGICRGVKLMRTVISGTVFPRYLQCLRLEQRPSNYEGNQLTREKRVLLWCFGHPLGHHPRICSPR